MWQLFVNLSVFLGTAFAVATVVITALAFVFRHRIETMFSLASIAAYTSAGAIVFGLGLPQVLLKVMSYGTYFAGALA